MTTENQNQDHSPQQRENLADTTRAAGQPTKGRETRYCSNSRWRLLRPRGWPLRTTGTVSTIGSPAVSICDPSPCATAGPSPAVPRASATPPQLASLAAALVHQLSAAIAEAGAEELPRLVMALDRLERLQHRFTPAATESAESAVDVERVGAELAFRILSLSRGHLVTRGNADRPNAAVVSEQQPHDHRDDNQRAADAIADAVERERAAVRANNATAAPPASAVAPNDPLALQLALTEEARRLIAAPTTPAGLLPGLAAGRLVPSGLATLRRA